MYGRAYEPAQCEPMILPLANPDILGYLSLVCHVKLGRVYCLSEMCLRSNNPGYSRPFTHHVLFTERYNQFYTVFNVYPRYVVHLLLSFDTPIILSMANILSSMSSHKLNLDMLEQQCCTTIFLFCNNTAQTL